MVIVRKEETKQYEVMSIAALQGKNNGRFRLRGQVKNSKSSKRINTGEVYDSKDAAEADIRLFRWYHENGHHTVNSTFNWKSDKPRGSSNSIWSNEIINKLDEACLENSEDTIPTSHSGGVKRKNRNLDVASSRKGSDRVKNFVLHKKTSWLRKHAIIYQPDDGAVRLLR